jgi:plastocyanin
MRFYLEMMRCLLLVGVLGAGFCAEAGNIRGHVQVMMPAVSVPVAGDSGKTNLSLMAAAKTNSSPPPRDFIVFLEGAIAANALPPFKPVNIQIRRNAKEDAVFSPRILPVLVGTSVVWRNDDSVYHQLFSLTEDAAFEFPPCAPGGQAGAWKFEKLGRVQVFCSLYANLNGTVLVLENPWYSGTDFRNNYFIQNVPPGTYKLTLWHENLTPQSQEISVPRTGEIRADFTVKLPPR